MTDEQALLGAIIANPDEDTPRLAYADWLLEYGDEVDRARAEFIRLQIAAAQGIASPRRRKAVEVRCNELVRTHHNRWLEPFWAVCTDPSVTVKFHRGFVTSVDGIRGSPRWFPAVAARCPIRELSFLGNSPPRNPAGFAVAAACPALTRVRWLEFYDVGHAAVEALLASPHLTGLCGSRLKWVSGTTLDILSRSPAATGLRELYVRDAIRDGVTPGSGLETLISTNWPALEGMRVESFGVSFTEAVSLTTAFAARGRKWLHIGDSELTRTGAQDTIAAALSGSLESLSLQSARPFGETVPGPLAGHELRLADFREGDALTAWLLDNVPPGRFDRLAIIRCGLNASSAGGLAGWPGLAHLSELDLSDNRIGDPGAAHLAESPYLDHIHTLHVSRNELTSRGRYALTMRFGRRVRVS